MRGALRVLALCWLALPFAAAAQQPVLPSIEVNEIEALEPVQEPDGEEALQGEEIPPPQGTGLILTPNPAGMPQSVPATAEPKPPAGDDSYDMAVLQGLNKVTARASTLEVPVGSVTRFGTIDITVHKCWRAAPEERPESAALLEIAEIKQGETPATIFSGWMFASSPAVSSLEHAFYDVTVLRCDRNKKQE